MKDEMFYDFIQAHIVDYAQTKTAHMSLLQGLRNFGAIIYRGKNSEGKDQIFVRPVAFGIADEQKYMYPDQVLSVFHQYIMHDFTVNPAMLFGQTPESVLSKFA